ncbi:hypothetical protein JZK55_20750 [Dissulfurispira thermophila]|uniref:Protein PsiE n=2 Tax=root TaxID=1 RepID=A0A7G1H4T6_9BACT|nr:phosphate-starvation-inducible PsiE family protein [Dissulfurispira thermophila]BCB97153.1 hypothetical protein JZK55_20750 [Dissulfurispira thermophila]
MEKVNKNISGKGQKEFYFWIHALFRKYIEVTMDIILIGLVIVTFIFIAKTIYLLGLDIYKTTNIPYVISEFLFIFILIEVMRILVVYIEFHHVSVDIMVELAIVAILREIIIKGAIELDTLKIVGISLLIAVLGFLLKFGDIRTRPHEDESTYKPFFRKHAKTEK